MARRTAFRTDIVLGERYRDTVSGFEGTATAVFFYMHGCERVLLERYETQAGEMKELTFDVPRLVHVESGRDITTKATGGWKPTPPRRGATG